METHWLQWGHGPVHRLVETVKGGWSDSKVAEPAELDDVDNARHDPSIIDPWDAMRQREKRLDPSLTVTLNVALGSVEGGMTSQELDIPERSAHGRYLLGGIGDEGPPPAVG